MKRKGGPSDPWPDYHRGPSAIAPRSRKASSGAWLTPPPHHDDDHITRSQPFYSSDSLTVDVASRSPSAQTRSTTQDSLTTPNNITSPQVSSWFATGTLSPASAGTAAPPGSRNRDDATARSPRPRPHQLTHRHISALARAARSPPTGPPSQRHTPAPAEPPRPPEDIGEIIHAVRSRQAPAPEGARLSNGRSGRLPAGLTRDRRRAGPQAVGERRAVRSCLWPVHPQAAQRAGRCHTAQARRADHGRQPPLGTTAGTGQSQPGHKYGPSTSRTS